MGFAVVDVNMRGTGCSGGAFDYFEPLQSLDAYDVIQTIAHQSWVLHHKVGMFGISYGGISQLFAAQTQPPALAAIAPLSVLDATVHDALPRRRPQHRLRRAVGRRASVRTPNRPAPPAVSTGPTNRSRKATRPVRPTRTCTAEATNLLAEVKENSTYNPSVADPLDPMTFVHNIDVPTFMACQWEDEQTGGHCADLAQHFTGTERKWFTFTNGVHADSLDPATINRLYDFLNCSSRARRRSTTGRRPCRGPVIY